MRGKRTLHSSEQRRFVATLEAVRTKKEITQVELAAIMGKPQSFVSKCLSGERRVDFVEWLWFCEALDITPEAFLRRMRSIS